MRKLKSLFAAAWAALGDDRIGLVSAGCLVASGAAAAKRGDYEAALCCAGLAIVIGGLAWSGVGRSIAKA